MILALRKALITVFSLLLSYGAAADGLRYKVEGVNKEVRENIRAYLGESPSERGAVERFLSTAPLLAAKALEALGYYEHEIDLQVDREGDPWRATLFVVPGEPLRYTAVSVRLLGEGADDGSLSAVVDARSPKPGDPLHHGRYTDLKRELLQVARRRGYFDAAFAENRVDLDVARQQATLSLIFDAGPRYRFGAVSLDEAVMDPGLLERLLPFKTGEPYEQRLLLELRQRLLRLGYFGSVTVLPDLPKRSLPTVPIDIALTKAPRHSYEVGVGFSTDTRQRLSLVWQSPRLNRWGHSQETALRWSPVNPQARVTYSIPLDDPANDVLQLIARLEDNEFGDLESEQQEFRLRRERTKDGTVRSVQVRALRERWGVFENNFDAGFILAGASLSSRYRRGDAVDPRSGVSQFYSLEGASADVGSDEDLLRLYGSVHGVRRFNERWRAVGRLEAGMLWTSSEEPQDLPPSLAFFAGGDNSIRGYAYQSLGREVSIRREGDPQPDRLVVGGTRLLTGSLELQRYFSQSWRGAVFVDAGDAFDSGDFETNVGLGIGVHYLSPVGALRLELANPVSDSDGSWRVHINIGAEF
ncbi:autotransporter assembly complex protein TamA [Congregibacter litoralis]|uniref:Translocation and assembly module subunit TamA n=1 Tax=Congregibacter litoralis KT71 TaxID=314285 RepID=A4A831_9GAMM|nr:BamA/TamA family outer membrane protein [Congregibacter litoralis]EAQ97826.1 autotransporter secretion outer membrane protein TamA [Congregibacter litoralis KT71]